MAALDTENILYNTPLDVVEYQIVFKTGQFVSGKTAVATFYDQQKMKLEDLKDNSKTRIYYAQDIVNFWMDVEVKK